MAKRLYYVHNGYYVEHVGDLRSCEQYIRNVKFLSDASGLTICVQRNGKYVPA